MNIKKAFITIIILSLPLIFLNCSSAKEEKTPPQNPIPKPAIEPGSVSVTAKINSLSEKDGKILLNVRIIKVNEYGMNTKPVAEGSELVLDVSEDLRANINDNKLFEVGRTAELLLKQPGETLGNGGTKNLKLINIK